MTDLDRAIECLKTEHHTCVLCKGEQILCSDRTGIAPMTEYLKEKTDLSGFSAADKIVGKAAAFLFVLAGVRNVYAEVMTTEAKNYLTGQGIKAICEIETDRIVNRKKTGICPMEQAVEGCTDPQEAFARIRAAQQRLHRNADSQKKLGFGMMRLPKIDPENAASIDLELVKQMADHFLERGFNYFDTAYMYHDAASEPAAKAVLSDRLPREQFRIATKLPTMHLKNPEDMERIFREQLKKTGAGYFDYYLLHCLNKTNYETAQRLDAFSFVQQKKEEGLVRKFGFSFHDSAELLDRILTEHPEVEFVQLQINYLDWESPTVQARLCYETARRHGKDIIVMEPIKGGTLAQIPKEAEEPLRAVHPDWSPAQWALRFAAGLEGVFMVLSGMSTPEQLEENTEFMQNPEPLTEQETELLFQSAEIINRSVAVSCTGCYYCVGDCPKQIRIPEWFARYNEAGKPGAVSFAPIQGGTPSACIACGRCERNCPQHLPIRRILVSVAKEFSEKETR